MTGRCGVMSGSGGLKCNWSRLHDRLEAAMAKKKKKEEKWGRGITASDLVGPLSQIHILISIPQCEVFITPIP